MSHPIEPILLAFTAQYGKLAEPLVMLVIRYMDNGLTVTQAVDKALIVVDAPTAIQKAVETAITASAAAGAGVESILLLPALTYAWDPSGMKLSEKLHSTAAEMRRKIIDTIETQQRLNKGAIEVARELYDGYNSGKRVIYQQRLPQYLDKIYAYARRSDLSTREQEKMLRLVRRAKKQTARMGTNGAPNQALKTAYKQLLQSVDKSIRMSTEKAVKTAIEEKSRYVAERIARTESARAWADAFLARYDADDSVAAYQWKLSSRHPVFDICDMYAKADLWGLGPGVFPKDKVPVLPAHPHCLCHLALVFLSEITDKTKKNRIKQGGDEWLDKKTHAQRCEVLGINGAHAWESGKDWRRYMRGWSTEQMTRRLAARAKFDKIQVEEISLIEPLSFVDNGIMHFIPKETVVKPQRPIAGRGSSKELRIAEKLVEKYGGNPAEWSKMVGTIESAKYLFDIHWYGHPVLGTEEFKIKSFKERGK